LLIPKNLRTFAQLMKKLLSILLLVIATVSIAAQDPGRAENLFTQGDYAAALRQYRLLHRDFPGTVLYTYRLGRCEQELGMYEEAVQHLTEAGDRYSMRPFWLARAAYPTYRFQMAKEMLEEFLEMNEPTESHYSAAEEDLRKAEQGLRFFNRVENIAYLDTVSFALDSLPSHLPLLSPDMGHVGMEGDRFVCTNERGDRRYFSFTDDKTGRRLIGRQERLLDTWTAIDTLPASVNQFDRQEYPFLMPDGVTLYYASQSEQGLGGWDIYVTKYNPATNTYLTPELLGMPFNSFADDALYLYDETAGRGYFLTNRASSKGKYTLYTFVREEPRYLRDSSETYLRSYVQLRTLPAASDHEVSVPSAADQLSSPILAELAVEQPEWTLVVNDSTVYTSLADFRSEEARNKMQEYLDLLDQISEEQTDLQQRRIAYANAESAAERESLAPLILSVENDVRRLKLEASALRREVLRLEHQ